MAEQSRAIIAAHHAFQRGAPTLRILIMGRSQCIDDDKVDASVVQDAMQSATDASSRFYIHPPRKEAWTWKVLEVRGWMGPSC